MNEIIWAYDFGGRSRRKWPWKHDTILWYAKDPSNYIFNYEALDRIPYMAPGLAGKEKAARGKTPTDVWWHTIVPTAGSERTGYPTQKPLGILRRIVAVHSKPDDLVLDPFSGSGTTGAAAHEMGRRFLLMDENIEAIRIASNRLKEASPLIETLPVGKSSVPQRSSSATSGTRSDSGLSNVGRISVLAVTVSSYEHLPSLRGPAADAKSIRCLFATSKELALYKGSTTLLENATSDQLRDAVVDYAANRSARGDILIFYFSGHGSIVGGPGSDFGFCTKDTRKTADGKVFPLSVVSFPDIVKTLAMADVHPVFIIDACFSSAISGSMQDDLHRHKGGSYAFLCSSHETDESLDFDDGGAFTKAFVAACKAGISGTLGKRRQCLTLTDLAPAVREHLEREGSPLSRCYVGPDLPVVPIARNVGFKTQRYKFSPQYMRLVELLYNDGDPIAIPISEFARRVGNGAYGNHTKLSYKPWGLLKDGPKPQTRELTSRGVRFVRGALSIPKAIELDPVSGAWQAVDGAERISYS